MNSSLSFDQSPDQVIQGRPEMIKNFSGDYREAERNGEFAEEREDIGAPLVLKSTDYSVWIGICRN